MKTSPFFIKMQYRLSLFNVVIWSEISWPIYRPCSIPFQHYFQRRVVSSSDALPRWLPTSPVHLIALSVSHPSLVWLGRARAAFRDMNSCCCRYHDWRASTSPKHSTSLHMPLCWLLRVANVWANLIPSALWQFKNWNLFILQRGGFNFLVLRLDWVLGCEMLCFSWKWCIKMLVSRDEFFLGLLYSRTILFTWIIHYSRILILEWA